MVYIEDRPKEVRSFQFPTEMIDVNKVFNFYKYVIPEHEPIKLSNGFWLHTYRLTRYDEWDDAYGDQDADYESQFS